MKSSNLLIFLFVSVFVFSSCKKDKEYEHRSSDPVPVEEEVSYEPPQETVSQNTCPVAGYVEKRGNGAGQYIVVLKSSAVNARSGNFSDFMQQKLRKNNVSRESVHHTFSGTFNGVSVRLDPSEAEALKNDPDIEYIEEDKIVQIEQSDYHLEALAGSSQIVPWGIKRVGGFADGTGKTVWVMDTGVDMDHPDLNVDKSRSVSFVKDVASPGDDNGHGTHVAGTIAAKDNGFGVVGVAPNATVVGVKVMGADGRGNISNIVAGVEYIIKHAKPGDVVNFSLGGAGISRSLESVVLQAAAKKIYFSMAAGNKSEHACINSPQRLNGEYLYTISAMDSTDTFGRFSNFGNGPVDYCAPGVRVLSTYPDGKYAYTSGTSMAAPHFAGILLLNGKNIKTSGYAKNDPDGVPDPISAR